MNKSIKSALFAVVGSLALVPLQAGHAAEQIKVESKALKVQHIVVRTPKKFADVCAFIEGKLGRFDQPMRDMLQKGQVDQLRAAATRIIQNYGLSIHYISYHGKLDILAGGQKNIMAYYIGDLLSASQMTRVVSAAGLYAPLRVVVYENETGGTTIEYDQPSTLFGQFHNPVTTKMGKDLDARLGTFVHDAVS